MMYIVVGRFRMPRFYAGILCIKKDDIDIIYVPIFMMRGREVKGDDDVIRYIQWYMVGTRRKK